MERREKFQTPTQKMIDRIINNFDVDCLPDYLDEYDGHELWCYNNGARIVVIKQGDQREYQSLSAYRLNQQMKELLQ